jgi:polyferredoxin
VLIFSAYYACPISIILIILLKKSILQKNYSSQGEEKESCNRDEPLIRSSIFIKLHLIIRFKLRKKAYIATNFQTTDLDSKG